ncbi:MAG: OsmC family protein [Thaumarchaeota archaeon]|nr:OsmC family protein [Nitrososphaerota archaeon]
MSNVDPVGMRAEVNWVEGYYFTGSDGSGQTLAFDSVPDDDPGKGMSPMRVLLAAVGACSGMDVVAILGKRKQILTSLKVELVGLRDSFGHPRPFTEISLKFTVTGKGLEERFVREAVSGSIEKYCSVTATVDGKAKLKYSYEILEG